jgi:hypothetical protein
MQTAVSQMVRDELKRNPRQLQDPTHHRELLDNQFPPANELLRVRIMFASFLVLIIF